MANCRFYLGTHQPQWLGRTNVPLFVSRRRLEGRKSLPRALGPWALDSGGFTEIDMHGGWILPAPAYVALVRRFHDEIGGMVFAAPQDWMCEPVMLEKTGLNIAEHQRRSVASYVELRDLAPDLPFMPVLQGWTRSDYLRCWELFEAAGVDLAACPIVGVGTVCRRQHGAEAVAIFSALRGLKLHGFGVKLKGLENAAHLLASADSMAWSAHARRQPTMCGSKTHRNCANCMTYALQWQEKADRLATAPPQKQASLFGGRW